MDSLVKSSWILFSALPHSHAFAFQTVCQKSGDWAYRLLKLIFTNSRSWSLQSNKVVFWQHLHQVSGQNPTFNSVKNFESFFSAKYYMQRLFSCMHPHTCKHAVANKDLIKSVTHTYTQKEPTLIQIHEDTCMYNTPQSRSILHLIQC